MFFFMFFKIVVVSYLSKQLKFVEIFFKATSDNISLPKSSTNCTLYVNSYRISFIAQSDLITLPQGRGEFSHNKSISH